MGDKVGVGHPLIVSRIRNQIITSGSKPLYVTEDMIKPILYPLLCAKIASCHVCKDRAQSLIAA